MDNIIAINCDPRTKQRQGPFSQALPATRKTAPAQENQYLRPRVVRQWALCRTIWQIARQERRPPSEIERILREEFAPYSPLAQAQRRAA